MVARVGRLKHDGSGDVADGGTGDVGAVGVEALAVDVDLATRHGRNGRRGRDAGRLR